MTFYDLDNSCTLGDYLPLWLDAYGVRLAQNTVNGYRVNIQKHIVPYLGTVPLGKLKPIMIQQLYGQLSKKGLSGTSCLYVHNTLKKALNTAVRLEILERNPALSVEAPRKSRHRITPLNLSQVNTLMRGCAAHADPITGMAVLLALLLGLRRGEVLGLRWDDIDMNTGTLLITRTVTPQKGEEHSIAVSDVKTENSNRTLLLANGLLKLLEQYRARAEPNPENYVFWRGDSILTTERLTRHFKALLRDCGLPNIRFHDLRHSNATLMLQQNIPAKIVSSMLGHSSIGITLDTYSHVLIDMQKPAVDVVERLLKL